MFDLAYFWRVSPAEIMRLSLTRFSQYELQAERIAEEKEKQQTQ